MYAATTRFENRQSRVRQQTDKGVFRNLSHAAASIRKTAGASLLKRKGPSQPGKPPHTHEGVYFRRALRYDVNKQKQDAVIGFQHSTVGISAAVHEHGEKRGRVQYPERPTIGPALVASIGRIAGQWQGSIGN